MLWSGKQLLALQGAGRIPKNKHLPRPLPRFSVLYPLFSDIHTTFIPLHCKAQPSTHNLDAHRNSKQAVHLRIYHAVCFCLVVPTAATETPHVHLKKLLLSCRLLNYHPSTTEEEMTGNVQSCPGRYISRACSLHHPQLHWCIHCRLVSWWRLLATSMVIPSDACCSYPPVWLLSRLRLTPLGAKVMELSPWRPLFL